MGRRKREPMSEGKRNIIAGLLQEYDIRTAKDIEDALKDLMSGTIQEMLEAEMDEHLGYSSYERSDITDYRNGKKAKKIRGNSIRCAHSVSTFCHTLPSVALYLSTFVGDNFIIRGEHKL